MAVWSEDGDVRGKDGLVILCVFQGHRDGIPVRLEKGQGETPDKLLGEGGETVRRYKFFQK